MVIWSVNHTTSSIKQMSHDVLVWRYVLVSLRKYMSQIMQTNYFKCSFEFFSMETKLNPKVYSKIPNYLNTNPGN